MWLQPEVANHLVVVLHRVVHFLVQPAAIFWFQATAPVLRTLQRDVLEMAALEVAVVAQ